MLVKNVSTETNGRTCRPEGERESDKIHTGTAFVRSIKSKGKTYFYLIVRLRIGRRQVHKVLCRLTTDEASRLYLKSLAREFTHELQKLKLLTEEFEKTQRYVIRLSTEGTSRQQKSSDVEDAEKRRQSSF